MRYNFLCNTSRLIVAERIYEFPELELIKNKLISGIHSMVAQNKCPVGVCLNRGVELPLAFIALWDLGTPYVPLSASWPDHKLKQIIASCGIEIIVTSTLYEERFRDYKIFVIENMNNRDTTCIADGINTEISDDELAYVMYTSGTTGEPKGVEVSRRSLVAFIDGFTSMLAGYMGQNILCVSSSTFDIFFVESLYALSRGMTVYLATEQQCNNPRILARLIASKKVSTLQLTPSRLITLCHVDARLSSLEMVSTIFIGGEDLPLWLLEKLRKNFLGEIINLYGPTECTIWASAAFLKNSDSIHLGTPFSGVNMFLFGENGRIAHHGNIGEIWISGEILADGYRGASKETAINFIYDEYNDTRIYKTGDYGVLLPDGKIRYIGRKDDQIKFHGYRIELGEIEHTLMRHPDLLAVKAIVADTSQSNNILVVFFIARRHIEELALRHFLREFLPSYMIPNLFIQVDHFPQNQNGKTDVSMILNELSVGSA